MKRIYFYLIFLISISTICSAHRMLYIGDSITDGAWGNSGGSGQPTGQ